MSKRKQLFSCLGSVFTFCMLLALTVLLPGTKADAALSLEGINYENSTITIGTNSGDTSLYFSDKNKKKWETAMDAFVNGKCTMDISWVSVTKDYVMTFKGDKTVDDILTVTIPKQVSNFKAKYDKKGNKVTFTNKPSDRKVEYRKNNTSNWTTIEDENTFGENLQRLYENGAKVYFRLAAESGSSGNAGKRYSKEVMCSITKKSEAPKITINDDATITVKSGWQVRRVTVQESGGAEYVTGYSEIDPAKKDPANYDELKRWYTYRSEKDVPVVEMVEDLKPDNTSTASENTTTTEEKPVYLQFRKEASSSAQVSHISTVKIPKQEAAPSDEDISIEYTSFTTFNLKIAKATTKNPYEYCIVNESDVKDNKIIEPGDAKWKTISSNAATEVKKSEAPENSSIFLRKKAVGKLGDEDFKLATDHVHAANIIYPTGNNETLQITKKPSEGNDNPINLIDGICTEDNQNGYIKFNITTRWNAKIKNIYLMEKANPTASDMSESVATVTQTSSVTKMDEKIEIEEGGKKEKVVGYTIAATIKGIKLNSTFAEKLTKSETPIKLYAYIAYDTSGDIGLSSNDEKGLVIAISKKSSIETGDENDDSSLTKTKDVKRIIGATSPNNDNSQYENIRYKVSLGTAQIKSVKLGNYPLTNHYKLENSTFTVCLAELEKEKDLEAYYGEKQNLIIELSNGEKLNDITITFIEPVSLDKLYSWAYRPSAIPNTEQKITTQLPNGGGTTTETKYINNYSIQYAIATETVNGVRVKTVTAKSATLGSIGILDKFDNATKKIEFSNDKLKECSAGLTSEPVKIAFDVTLSNNEKYEYIIKQGCMFTVLS